MNINVCLGNELLKSLDQFVKSTGQSRSVVIRNAIQEYVVRNSVKKWPESILKYKGMPGIKSFESERKNLNFPKEDIL